VPLEQLFDNNDVLIKPDVQVNEQETENHNIGTEDELKMVKLSQHFSQ